MSWTIGYKDGDNGTLVEIEVDVDEVSPKDHYLYLYNIETAEDEVTDAEQPDENESEDVVEIEQKELAKVKGFFNPASWVYAISGDVLVLN